MAVSGLRFLAFVMHGKFSVRGDFIHHTQATRSEDSVHETDSYRRTSLLCTTLMTLSTSKHSACVAEYAVFRPRSGPTAIHVERCSLPNTIHSVGESYSLLHFVRFKCNARDFRSFLRLVLLSHWVTTLADFCLAPSTALNVNSDCYTPPPAVAMLA